MLETAIDARWAERKRRAAELRERWSFSSEVLSFYAALLETQEQAFAAALEERPSREQLVDYVAERVLPRVIEVSAASGPPAMVENVLGSYHERDLRETLAAWMRGDDLPAVERYLARASAGPVLEALGSAAASPSPGPRDDRLCPACGGLPQLGYFAPSPEDLVTAHRYLECSRCATAWAFSRMTCASCGENETKNLVIYGEIGTGPAEVIVGPSTALGTGRPKLDPSIVFPHVRVDGCKTCSRYLLTVNLERDGKAVPVVDELAAIPLSLYANERGMTKLVPNLMGF